MNKIDEKIKKIFTEKINVPEEYTLRIYDTLYDLNKNKNEQLKRMIICTITVILCFTVICFAGVRMIYFEDNNITVQDSLQSNRLFDVGDGISNCEYDLTISNMNFDPKTKKYYKIITDYVDYIKYNERLNCLPQLDKNYLNEIFFSNYDLEYKKTNV